MREPGDLRVTNTWNVAVGDIAVNNFYYGPQNQCVLVTDRHIVLINGENVAKVFDVSVVASVFAAEENVMFAVLRDEPVMVVYSLDNFEVPFAKMPLEQVRVFEVMFSGPDTVITVGNDIRIWNYQKISLFKGKCMVNLGLRAVINLNFHESVRNSLCVAESQKWILIPTERGFVAYDCDGHVQSNVSASPAAPGDPAAVSRGGVLATSHGKCGIVAWKLSGEKIASCEAGGVKRLAWMDEAVVVYVDQSECLCVWDVKTGKNAQCSPLSGCEYFGVSGGTICSYRKGVATFMTLGSTNSEVPAPVIEMKEEVNIKVKNPEKNEKRKEERKPPSLKVPSEEKHQELKTVTETKQKTVEEEKPRGAKAVHQNVSEERKNHGVSFVDDKQPAIQKETKYHDVEITHGTQPVMSQEKKQTACDARAEEKKPEDSKVVHEAISEEKMPDLDVLKSESKPRKSETSKESSRAPLPPLKPLHEQEQEIIKVLFHPPQKIKVDRCTSPFPDVSLPEPEQQEEPIREPEIPKLDIAKSIRPKKISQKQPPVSCPRPLFVPKTGVRRKQPDPFSYNVSAHYINMTDFFMPASARLPSIIPRYRLLEDEHYREPPKTNIHEPLPKIHSPNPHMFQPNPRFREAPRYRLGRR